MEFIGTRQKSRFWWVKVTKTFITELLKEPLEGPEKKKKPTFAILSPQLQAKQNPEPKQNLWETTHTKP